MISLITKLMYSLHRILGTLLCMLFFIWFFSAFVMMYHRFPSVSTREKMQKLEQLSATEDTLPHITSVLARLPQGEKIKKVTLDRYLGQTVFHIRTNKGERSLPLDSLSSTKNHSIQQIAALWCSAPVSRIDTLHSLDQWIPFGALKKKMPIYKVHFSDKASTQLYISSKDGEVLQMSDKNERFWAWLGPIPHWVYFTWLRQDVELWSRTVIWLSGLGCLMLIAGVWITVNVWRKSRRSRYKRFSPYRKRWYHWHYVSGIFFGVFVLTFTFSGMMSVADIPEWIHKPALQSNPVRLLQEDAPRPEQYQTDYRAILAAYPQTKQLVWSNFREHPYYTVKDGKSEQYLEGLGKEIQPLQLSKDEIYKGVTSIYASQSTGLSQMPEIKIEEINRFETYYRDMSGMLRGRSQLPVWKVTVDDPDKSVFYIHPETGNIRYVSTSTRWKYWTYTALHRMRLPGLNSNGTLRKTVLWVLLLGGTMVSVTGVVLSVKYLRRKSKKKRKNFRYLCTPID